MSWNTEDFKERREHQQRMKAAAREANSDKLYCLIPELEEAGFDHHKRSDYHWTFTKDGKRLDIYPTTLKFHYIPNNTRGQFGSFDELRSRLLSWK